jgi:hypothetical protein
MGRDLKSLIRRASVPILASACAAIVLLKGLISLQLGEIRIPTRDVYFTGVPARLISLLLIAFATYVLYEAVKEWRKPRI